MKLTNILIAIGIVIIGILALYQPCNPKGSIAAKINWAGNPVCK